MFESLVRALADVNEDEALAEARALLARGEDPLRIIGSCSAGMQVVGQRFEAGEYFLPELLMAGEVVKEISALVKPMLDRAPSSKKKGLVALATVKGDIHNIGKDIVASLLEVNGFEVLDLGVDVTPAAIVRAIEEHHPAVLGLSGLLTVAYDSMKRTVEAIEAAGLRDRVKIMIGGAVVSEAIREYARADAFGADAVAGVRLAERWTLERAQ